MNRGKRLAAPLVAVWIMIFGAPTVAAPPVERVTLVLKRTTSGPSSFTLDVGVTNDHSNGSFVGEVGARIVRGKPVSVVPAFAASSRRWEDTTLRVGDLTVTSCQVGVCHDDHLKGYQGLGTTYSDDGRADEPNYFFVVAYGHNVEFGFRGTGWRVFRAPLAFRYVDGPADAEASSHLLMASAEVFTGATATGGRLGSLAVAIPPCSVAMSGLVARGVGRVTLEGGAEPVEATCPADRTFIGSYARAATRWRLTGTAAGDSSAQDTRMFVLDLPKRLP